MPNKCSVYRKGIKMGIWDFLFGKKSADSKKNDKQQPASKFSTTIKAQWVKCKSVGKLSRLDFGKPAGELGCFLNYNVYNLKYAGLRGRTRKAWLLAYDEQHAIDRATALGYVPLYEVTLGEHEAPTERQLNYLKDLGVVIPDGITKDDASCLISRATGEDSEEGPSPALVALAFGMNKYFSAFIGADGLLSDIVYGSNDRNRAALYAYGVRQCMRGEPFGNMLEDPDLSVYYAFADKVLADEALLRSLSGREPSDYKNPYRGTAIYKAAAAHLTDNGM